jgi:hypothetical protein
MSIHWSGDRGASDTCDTLPAPYTHGDIHLVAGGQPLLLLEFRCFMCNKSDAGWLGASIGLDDISRGVVIEKYKPHLYAPWFFVQAEWMIHVY